MNRNSDKNEKDQNNEKKQGILGDLPFGDFLKNILENIVITLKDI